MNKIQFCVYITFTTVNEQKNVIELIINKKVDPLTQIIKHRIFIDTVLCSM